MTYFMAHCDDNGMEHCDAQVLWRIVMTKVMEHCDDKGLEHCDDKGMEHCDDNGH